MTRDSSSTTRRTVLRLGGGVLIAGLAGCTGGGDGGAGTATDEMGDAEMDETTASSGMDDEMTESMDDDDGMTDSMDATQRFRVRIENVSTESTLQSMSGNAAVPLSPGVFVVHKKSGALFRDGEPASAGLEALAEDGMAGGLAEELAGMMDDGGMRDDEMTESMDDEMTESMDDEMTDSMDDDEMTESMDDGMTTESEMSDGSDMTLPTSGAFDTPVGADAPAPIGPGGAYEFEVAGGHDARLSFATMFVQSNDLFYAPAPEGIALWADDEPISGSVTDQVQLWDAGTETNEEPGAGDNQAPRQSGPDTGTDENGTVRLVSEVDDGYDYPATAEVVEVTVTPLSMQ